MDNNDLKKLLTSANKFFHSQYDFNISVGEARYKNYDLLTVYKINELCKMGKISENERDSKKDYVSIMNDNISLLKQELYK